jgi:predicted alpha/beta-fold hydrolase
MGEKSPFVGAVGISVPLDLLKCMGDIEDTVYGKFFLEKYFDKTMIPHLDVLKTLEYTHSIDFNKLLNVTKLRDLHE